MKLERPLDGNEDAVSGLSRRTVMKGAAWAVPVVTLATASPAMAAASTCHPSTNLQGLQVGSKPSSIQFYDVNGNATCVIATISYSSSGQGGDNTPGNTGEVSQTNSNPSWKYLNVQMVSRLDEGDYVNVTFTFNHAVTGLSFLVHDIDKVQNQWVDEVWVQNPTSGFTYVGGSAIIGNGTSASPFTSNTWGDLPIETGQGSVRITFTGPVQTVTIQYRAGINGNAGSQHVGIGDLSYNSCPDVCDEQQSRMMSRQLQVSGGSSDVQLIDPYVGDLSLLEAGPEQGADDR